MPVYKELLPKVLKRADPERLWREAQNSLQQLKGTATFTIFHNPKEEFSRKCLRELSEQSRGESAKFGLQVHERVPTAEEWRKLHRCNNREPSFRNFLREYPKSTFPTNAEQMYTVVAERPETMKWPIVVNWDSGDIMTGKDRSAMKSLFRPLRLMDEDVLLPRKGKKPSALSYKMGFDDKA